MTQLQKPIDQFIKLHFRHPLNATPEPSGIKPPRRVTEEREARSLDAAQRNTSRIRLSGQLAYPRESAGECSRGSLRAETQLFAAACSLLGEQYLLRSKKSKADRFSG